MRLVRSGLLLAAIASGTWLLADLALGPLIAGWQVARGSDPAADGTSAPELVSLLVGGCALLAALAWLWLLAALTLCTWEALRVSGFGAPMPAGGPGSLLRPQAVRVLVATALGVTALAGPAAHASPLAGRARTLPDDLSPAAGARRSVTLGLLDGLPVPDRVSGGARDRSRGLSAQATVRAPDRAPADDRTVRVDPGDCLWSLAAGLLPPGSPTSTVAEGWRLLYAANREVVGPDPDLLQPGQTLQIDPAFEALADAASTGTALHHHAGGSR